MHVYHYAPYETTAAKRLAAKYATREEEVDILLREGVFVDLYRVVRRALQGNSGLLLKDVEHLYREKRSGDVATGGASVVAYHEWTVSGESGDWRKSLLLRHIRDYNEEDCRPRWIRAWLREHLKEERARSATPPGRAPFLRRGRRLCGTRRTNDGRSFAGVFPGSSSKTSAATPTARPRNSSPDSWVTTGARQNPSSGECTTGWRAPAPNWRTIPTASACSASPGSPDRTKRDLGYTPTDSRPTRRRR